MGAPFFKKVSYGFLKKRFLFLEVLIEYRKCKDRAKHPCSLLKLCDSKYEYYEVDI